MVTPFVITMEKREAREGEEKEYIPLAAFAMEVNSVNRAIKELNYTCTVSEVGFVLAFPPHRLLFIPLIASVIAVCISVAAYIIIQHDSDYIYVLFCLFASLPFPPYPLD